MKQPCRCTRCRTSFEVTYAKHAGVWEVYQKIATKHTKLKPKCADKWGTQFVRAIA